MNLALSSSPHNLQDPAALRSMAAGSSGSPLLTRLRHLADAGTLRLIDLHLGRLLHSLGAEPEVVLAGTLASFEAGQGHICVPWQFMRQPFGLDARASAALLDGLAPAPDWPCILKDSPLVSQGENPAATAPLVFWKGSLYLTRYHDHEREVAQRILARVQSVQTPVVNEALNRLFPRPYASLMRQWQAGRLPDAEVSAAQAEAWARQHLDMVKPEGLDWPRIQAVLQSAQTPEAWGELETLIPPSHCLNAQKLAVATAAGRAFTVISGGPGTGKTTTVAKLLALLLETGLAQGRAPLIRLAAPTGKAAARLNESLGVALRSLPLAPEVACAMPTSAGTLHRLLGHLPGQNRFRHDASNPLHLDVLVLDEASMVDLPLMSHLLQALPAHARLVLLGDKDQLASVEVGAVLADLCDMAGQALSQPHAQWLQAQTGHPVQGDACASPLRDGLCLLTKSWRFHEHSGIGQLAKACHSGQAEALEAVWACQHPDVQAHPCAQASGQALMELSVQGYQPYLQAMAQRQDPLSIFKAFHRFRVLCALREGPLGVQGLNQRMAAALQQAGLLTCRGEWYAGRAIMVTSNDHGLGLYNGDVGLCLPNPQGQLRVFFEKSDGTLRSLSPTRLPPHEAVWAMTVHKSQGSEFDHTVLVLPDQPSPLLTREWLYTGITRARTRLDVFGHPDLMAQAVRCKTVRHSGLASRLAEGLTFHQTASL